MQRQRAGGGDRREHAAGERGDDDLHQGGQGGRVGSAELDRGAARSRDGSAPRPRLGIIAHAARRAASVARARPRAAMRPRVALAAIREEARRVGVACSSRRRSTCVHAAAREPRRARP